MVRFFDKPFWDGMKLEQSNFPCNAIMHAAHEQKMIRPCMRHENVKVEEVGTKLEITLME